MADDDDELDETDTLHDVYRMMLEQQHELAALRREVRSLRSSVRRIVKAVDPPRDHNDADEGEC